MGPRTTLTPKIFKLNVHLGYMQVPLSTNFPIKTCLPCKGLMILGYHIMKPEQCMLTFTPW